MTMAAKAEAERDENVEKARALSCENTERYFAGLRAVLREQRRFEAASRSLAEMMANRNYDQPIDEARVAIKYADALIAELDKERDS